MKRTVLEYYNIKVVGLIFCAAGLVGLSACKKDSDPAGCTMGETQLCYCSASLQGVQICLDDGTWGLCDCGDASEDVERPDIPGDDGALDSPGDWDGGSDMPTERDGDQDPVEDHTSDTVEEDVQEEEIPLNTAVDCGGAFCLVTQDCCYAGDSFSCVDPGTCSGVVYQCDERADCPENVCCQQPDAGYASMCGNTSSCWLAPVVCSGESECWPLRPYCCPGAFGLSVCHNLPCAPIDCGGVSCLVHQECCVDFAAGSLECVDVGTCSNLVLACDEQADCAGQVCCYGDDPAYMGHCVPFCDGSMWCRDESECPPEEPYCCNRAIIKECSATGGPYCTP